MLDGVERDYLTIGYADDDLLCPPSIRQTGLGIISGQMNKHRGSPGWARGMGGRQSRCSSQEVAQELLELYAKRQEAKGFVFSKDTEWQKNLESSFPYTETPDQARAIEEVKKGYGKRARWTGCYAVMLDMEKQKWGCGRYI
jgi:transcription-repair coupling factor (superfamily II helicase)